MIATRLDPIPVWYWKDFNESPKLPFLLSRPEIFAVIFCRRFFCCRQGAAGSAAEPGAAAGDHPAIGRRPHCHSQHAADFCIPAPRANVQDAPCSTASATLAA
jgi:hypothetical protein